MNRYYIILAAYIFVRRAINVRGDLDSNYVHRHENQYYAIVTQ